VSRSDVVGALTAPRSAVADAEPRPFWTDRAGAPAPRPPLTGHLSADLVIIGGGFTGLWAAIEARARFPEWSVVLLEGRGIGQGASTRNGGFISASLTHGLAHGQALWPGEMETLVRLGRENLAQIQAFCSREGIEADLRICGKTTVAVTEHQVANLADSLGISRQFGEDVMWLDADEVRADVASPTYRAGLRVLGSSGLVDPARLAWGLACAASVRGVRLFENSSVSGVSREGHLLRVRTSEGQVRTPRVLLATNAYPPLLRRLKAWVLPIYDHVLVTEPLSAEQWRSIGWNERQGLTDAGNQFHYYRPTDDGRILWGGYDAIYYFGNDTSSAREQRLASHQLLADHFFTTFPQLEGLRFTHRWAGLIDSTSRFTPAFGLAKGGGLAYAVGYTGLGVGASRFGARVALDLLSGERTERTQLQMVRHRPVPFPPEPLRYPVVQLTRSALAREDRTGRRGAWLSLLDRFKVGFNS